MEQTRQAAGEKAVLAGLDAACFTKEETASEVSLTELQALLETAGGECVGKVLQSRPRRTRTALWGRARQRKSVIWSRRPARSL
ncbi:MAG: hypothetical protein V8S92_05385 [Oscillospiraceae bacterium]